ncbi:MAG: ABC transporter permease [Acholeplasmatales bacterium]|nr:ABC transporter permease [Acholeplasmatales bacterium]
MFSKALFKQSCKANGIMWLIITAAVCFMLACVMLISGKSDIGEVKDSIQTTIIEATIESNMKKQSISTYEVAITGVDYFDEAFVDEFYVEVAKSDNQTVYGQTYTTLVAQGVDSDTAKAQAFQLAFVKPAYEAAVTDLSEYAYKYALAVDESYTSDSDEAKTIYNTMMFAVDPNGAVDETYVNYGDTAPEEFILNLSSYLQDDATQIILGNSSTTAQDYLDSDERVNWEYNRAENATAVLIAYNTTNDEAVEATVESLAEYGVTKESYAKFGFTYETVKDISYTATLTYQERLDYEMSKLTDSEKTTSKIAEIKSDLGLDIAGSFLDSLPEEVSDAISEIGAMDLYGLIVGSIFFKMAGLLLPIIYIIMVSNNLIVGQVDTGSMAYILSTSTKRREVTFTQGVFLIGSVALMFVCTTITSIICYYIADVDTTLNVGKLLIINLGAFLVLFAISGINFFTSCYYDRSKKSMALGGGLSMFFLVATMLGLFGSHVIPSVIRIGALNYFNYVSIISLFDVVNVLDGGYMWIWKLVILLAIGVVGYVCGAIKFRKKDLPL